MQFAPGQVSRFLKLHFMLAKLLVSSLVIEKHYTILISQYDLLMRCGGVFSCDDRPHVVCGGAGKKGSLGKKKNQRFGPDAYNLKPSCLA